MSLLHALTLQSGDVILISFNCYECRVIENETDSPFSHSGVVLKDESGNLKIAQSLGQIALYNPQDFFKYKTPNTKAYVYRAYELHSSLELDKKMLDVFILVYKGLLFYVKFLWNNYDNK